MHSEAAANFLTKFNKLVSYIDDDPRAIEKNYHNNETLRKLTDDASEAAWAIEYDALTNPSKISISVEKAFIERWNIYKERYAVLISMSFFRLDDELLPLSKRKISIESVWENADENAKYVEECFTGVVELARNEFDIRDELKDNGQVEMEFDDGFEVFDKWIPGVGISIRRSLRRSRLLKIVNFSHQISSISGGAREGVMGYLNESHRAFVLGADFGAIILMRSTLEKILKDLYLSGRELGAISPSLKDGSKGDPTLKAVISKASKGNEIKKRKWDQIKDLGNDLAHGRDSREFIKNERIFEIAMMNHFEELRKLIEQAPV